MLIIHGDDTTRSRLHLNSLLDQAKKKGRSIVRLEAKNLDLTNLTQILESDSLFQEEKTIVIFSLFSLPTSSQKNKILDYLKKNQDKNIILYQDKSVASPTLRSFSETKSELFKISPIIFNFLESLKPGDSTQILKTYFNLEKQEPVEMIFAMLVRQIRLMITAKSNPEKISLAPWQKTRLINQVKNFTLENLLTLHQNLYQIDKSIKTGANPLPLSIRLQNFLLNL